MQATHTLSLTALRDALAKGAISAESAVQACLDRINATEGRVQALLARNDEAALEQARQLDRQGPDPKRPLWGVPVTVKDALCTKGLTTTSASRILENFVPPYDACVVERLREAGAILLAKNNMDEFAMGSSTEHSAFHPTFNPWDTSKVPGGSSGGSAASVAAGQCFASLGTDTGGSIRQPAALCGCVGLKPSYGRVSRYGVLAYGSSLEQVGPLARSVEDVAQMLQVIAGHDPRDSTSSTQAVPDYCAALHRPSAKPDLPLKGLRLGVPREFMNVSLHSEVATAYAKTQAQAQSLGAELVEVSLPHTEHSIATYYVIATAEAGSNLARFDGVRYGRRAQNCVELDELYTRSRTEGFGEEVQRRILLGAFVLSAGYYDAYYRKAAQVRRLIRQDFDTALANCHALLSPVSPLPAWPSRSVTDPLQLYLMDIFTLSLNLAGLPGLSIPVAHTQDGLPIGAQLMGKAFDEATLLHIGHHLTHALGTSGQCAKL